ncbi:MAG: hypothetical protein ACH37Z_19620, partial [Anaerolineae bacterium]
ASYRQGRRHRPTLAAGLRLYLHPSLSLLQISQSRSRALEAARWRFLAEKSGEQFRMVSLLR